MASPEFKKFLAKNNRYTREQISEKNLLKAKMIEELYVIFKDFYEGELEKDPRGLKYRMPNGQRFYIIVQPLRG